MLEVMAASMEHGPRYTKRIITTPRELKKVTEHPPTPWKRRAQSLSALAPRTEENWSAVAIVTCFSSSSGQFQAPGDLCKRDKSPGSSREQIQTCPTTQDAKPLSDSSSCASSRQSTLTRTLSLDSFSFTSTSSPAEPRSRSPITRNTPAKLFRRLSSRSRFRSSLQKKVKQRKENEQPLPTLPTRDIDVRQSRSRTRGKRKRSTLEKITQGLFACGGTRSASRTPERHSTLRVDRMPQDIKLVRTENNNNYVFNIGSFRRKKKTHSESSESSAYSAASTGSRNSCNSFEPPNLPPPTKTVMPNHTPLSSRAPSQNLIPPPESSIHLVKTIRLDSCMKLSKWISGIKITKKNEIVVADLNAAYLLDEDGNLKKAIGAKGSSKLVEPIDVTVMSNGNLVFSDHADQTIKIYNWKGQFLRQIEATDLSNIAGVAINNKREVFVAGTDRQCISVYSEEDNLLYTIPSKGNKTASPFEHPYSIAISPVTGNIIVGDDTKQMVMAVGSDGRILWRFSPSSPGTRHFFPSSICVDNVGYVFIADLYNEKIYMLDSSGKCLKTLLSRGGPVGLKGGPSAIAVDARGHLLVADEERTIRVFKYAENGFALYRRYSVCPQAE